MDKRTKTYIQLAVIETATILGVGKTEMSYSQAAAQFGGFFKDMVRKGQLKPVRIGRGRNGTHWYSVWDIIALKGEEEAKAMLI